MTEEQTEEHNRFLIQDEDGRDRDSIGYYIGINWARGRMAMTPVPMSLGEFMDMKKIVDPNDCIGPYHSKAVALAWQERVSVFFRKWATQREGVSGMMNCTLMDLFKHNMI